MVKNKNKIDNLSLWPWLKIRSISLFSKVHGINLLQDYKKNQTSTNYSAMRVVEYKRTSDSYLEDPTHLYVEFSTRQYSVPLNVHVGCDLHPKRNSDRVLFLDVLQQFVFMHWLWFQYRELRLYKLAHAAAALSVAFGYNCGMGDIRTTTEAQGKER